MSVYGQMTMQITPEDLQRINTSAARLVIRLNQILNEEFEEHDQDEDDTQMDKDINQRVLEAAVNQMLDVYIAGAARAAVDSTMVVMEKNKQE